MLWCMAEAHRILKRRLWLTDGTVSTTILQDARKGKLTMRFVAANSKLIRRSGHMGTVDLASEFRLD